MIPSHTLLLLSNDKGLTEILEQYCSKKLSLSFIALEQAIETDAYHKLSEVNADIVIVDEPYTHLHIDEHISTIFLGNNKKKSIKKPITISNLFGLIDISLQQVTHQEQWPIGNFLFSPNTRTLHHLDTVIRLTEKETSLLMVLYEAGGHIVSPEILHQRVWGHNNSLDTHTLPTHIYRLRQKIEQKNDNIPFIITENGGYRLVL